MSLNNWRMLVNTRKVFMVYKLQTENLLLESEGLKAVKGNFSLYDSVLFNCPPPLALYIIYYGKYWLFFFLSKMTVKWWILKKDGNQDDAGLNEEQRTKITVNKCF